MRTHRIRQGTSYHQIAPAGWNSTLHVVCTVPWSRASPALLLHARSVLWPFILSLRQDCPKLRSLTLDFWVTACAQSSWCNPGAWRPTAGGLWQRVQGQQCGVEGVTPNRRCTPCLGHPPRGQTRRPGRELGLCSGARCWGPARTRTSGKIWQSYVFLPGVDEWMSGCDVCRSSLRAHFLSQ